MLNAKLFASLALVLLLVALLTSEHELYLLKPATVISFFKAIVAARHERGSLLVVAGLYARLWLGLICGALGLAYFFLGKWAKRPPNRIIALMGFVTVTVGVVIDFSWNSLTRHHPPPDNDIPVFLLYAAAYHAFYLGCLLCLANLVWAAIREAMVRIRLRIAA
ncbi:MAG TPA: hypothetical protein VEJ46_12445 [Candidatus Acidoferrum sp.]|nr:hypothetical protein [Candidatus Acidoferrum sp.]